MSSTPPMILTCPSCQTTWELTAEEATGQTFTCTECQTEFDLSRERGEDKPAGTSGFRCLRGSLIAAGALLALDVLINGSFTTSLFVGPIWLLVAVGKAIFRRNNWRLSIKRILIPLLTLGIVFSNAWLQSRMARANAELIVKACTTYRAAKGAYPSTLNDLVPVFLRSVPRAKYDLFLGNFDYSTYKGRHSLMWVAIPPFGRSYYDFEEAKWGYLD